MRTVATVKYKQQRHYDKISCSIGFLVVLTTIAYITVFSRSKSFLMTYNLIPLWSYVKAFQGQRSIAKEIFLNILMFFPLGYFLRGAGKVKHSAVPILLISASIEVVQLVFRTGLFEFDDLISNTIGGVLGIRLYECTASSGKTLLRKWLQSLFIAGCIIVGIFFVKSEDRIIEKEFEFQITSVSNQSLDGYCFIFGKDAPDKYSIVLKSTDAEITLPTRTGIENVEGKYFACSYDYSSSGFSADISVIPNALYEIYVDFPSVGVMPSGAYFGNGKVSYSADSGARLCNEITENGYLLVAQSHCFVYQYQGNLYWLMDEEYPFEDDESTYIQYQLFTTQPESLPQIRIQGGWDWDNIGFVFEDYEIEPCGEYRIAMRPLPREYSITTIVTGYHKDGKWVWKEYFRPVLEELIN